MFSSSALSIEKTGKKKKPGATAAQVLRLLIPLLKQIKKTKKILSTLKPDLKKIIYISSPRRGRLYILKKGTAVGLLNFIESQR